MGGGASACRASPARRRAEQAWSGSWGKRGVLILGAAWKPVPTVTSGKGAALSHTGARLALSLVSCLQDWGVLLGP